LTGITSALKNDHHKEEAYRKSIEKPSPPTPKTYRNNAPDEQEEMTERGDGQEQEEKKTKTGRQSAKQRGNYIREGSSRYC